MLLVGKDVKYAANAGVVNAALTPDMLDAGSVGIYTVGSDGKTKLIIKGAAGAGQIASTAVTKGVIQLHVGLGSNKTYISEQHDVKGIQRISGSKYRLGTGETVYIGYNGTNGDIYGSFINPATVVDTDLLYRQQVSIKFKRRMAGNNEFGNLHYITVPVSATDTKYSVLAKLAAQANKIQPGDTIQYFNATLTGSALDAAVVNPLTTATTGGTIAASTPVFVKVYAKTSDGLGVGSNEVNITTGAGTATNVVGASWNNVVGNSGYRVFIGSASGNYTKYFDTAADVVTLNYTGAAGTAGTLPTGLTPAGLKLVAIDTTARFDVSLFGVIENSNVTQIGIVPSSGSPAQITAFERDSNAYRGDLYTLDALQKHLPTQVDAAATYDLYNINTVNTSRSKDSTEALMSAEVNTMVAFVVQGDVVDTNQQANFEDIMTDIFPATDQISA